MLDSIAATVVEAIPYIARYVGKTIVVKLGGSVGPEDTVLQDVVWLRQLGIRPVLVHGGGPLISEWLNRIGKETRFVRGLRYTDAETLDIVRMVLIGQVNSELVARLNAAGARAVGLSGIDGAMIQATLQDEELGLVGEVTAVDLTPIETLERGGYTVVVAPVALGPNGQPLNVNADTVAGEIARALSAEKLVFFTDVPGLLDAQGRLISELDPGDVERLRAEGVIRGGMIPKIDACLRALQTVPRAHIVDGREPHALIRELFTDRGVGTMIRAAANQSQ